MALAKYQLLSLREVITSAVFPVDGMVRGDKSIQPDSARNLTASRAAMQPMPAEVTACR